MSLFVTCRTTEELAMAALLVADAPLESFQGSPPGPLVVEPRTYQPGAFGDFAGDLLDFHFDAKARKEFLEEKQVQLFVKIEKITDLDLPSYLHNFDLNWDPGETPGAGTPLDNEVAGGASAGPLIDSTARIMLESGQINLYVDYVYARPDISDTSPYAYSRWTGGPVHLTSVEDAILELGALPTSEVLLNEEVTMVAIVAPNFGSLVDANLMQNGEPEPTPPNYKSSKAQVQSALRYAAFYNGIGAGQEPLFLYDHASVKGVWEPAQPFVPFTGETWPPGQALNYPPNPEVRAGDFRLGIDLLPPAPASPESKSALPKFRTVVYLPADANFPVGGGYFYDAVAGTRRKFENPMAAGDSPIFFYGTPVGNLLEPAYTGPLGESQTAQVTAYERGYNYRVTFRDTEEEEELPPPPPGP
ncbi:hypothetical protein BH20VER3_BH20VER3_00970 [soil metagenome]